VWHPASNTSSSEKSLNIDPGRRIIKKGEDRKGQGKKNRKGEPGTK